MFRRLVTFNIFLSLFIPVLFFRSNIFLEEDWSNNKQLFIDAPIYSENYVSPSVVSKLEPLVITEHTVNKNENIWSIARLYGTNVLTIRSINNLQSTLIYPGQRLKIINKRGLLHKVSKGETLFTISSKYKVPIERIIEANESGLGFSLDEGDTLFIPKAYVVFHDFIFPVRGRVTSRFGWRVHPIFRRRMFHEGVDIRGPYHCLIRASREGRVIFAGRKRGYGKLVVIVHTGGYSTRYGHLWKVYVRKGQWIKKGQIIGRQGSSGWTTGPHVHFEIRRYGRPLNPLRYLSL